MTDQAGVCCVPLGWRRETKFQNPQLKSVEVLSTYKYTSSTRGGKVNRNRQRNVFAIAGLAVLAMLVSAFGCIALPRYKSVQPRKGPAPLTRLAQRIDPWLVADGLAKKVVIEVDWVEGCKPGPLTLAGLQRVVEKYGPPGRPVEIRTDDEIPLREWESTAKSDDDQRIDALVSAHAEPVHETGVEPRYILFAPLSKRGLFGFSTTWPFQRDGVNDRVSGVVVFRENHARYAKLWISLDKLERMTLVHEFGHQFGLVADPRHERTGHHTGHCTRLDCAMAHPTRRVIVRNFIPGVFGHFFTDYCRECQAEIRMVQAEWRRQQAADPEWVAKRTRERETQGSLEDLSRLYSERKFAELLEAVDGQLQQDSLSPSLRRYRRMALVGLARFDEMRADWEAFPSEDADQWARESWTLGRGLIAAGRNDEVVALYQGKLDTMEDYEYEQSSIVLRSALEGLGEYAKAADVCFALLATDHDISFERTGMQLWAVGLLRRAGQLERAEQVLKPLMKKSRARALGSAAQLRRAQGREPEARALWEEELAPLLNRDSKFKTKAMEQSALYRAAQILARLSRLDEARATLQRAENLSVSEEERRPWEQIAAWALVGDFEKTAELVRSVNAGGWIAYDTCTHEELLPMRSDQRYSDLFQHCPPLVAKDASSH